MPSFTPTRRAAAILTSLAIVTSSVFVAAPAVAEEAPPAELTTQVEETTAPDGIVVPAEVTVVPVEETDTAEEPVVPTAGAEAPLEEVVEADVVEDAPAAPASAQRVAVLAVDTTAPTVISAVQKFEENVQNNGQIAVTLTFSEPVVKPGQGWNGSGTTWTKVYYSHNKSYSVTFVDLAGNPGQTSFTIDKLAPTVTSEKQRTELKNGELRLAVTLTFSEAVDPASLPQGWYGSGKVYTKSFYKTQSADVTATDLVGNPGVSTINVVYTPPVVVTLAPAARAAEAPVELVEAPAEQAPAVEAPAEEAPVEEAPAEVVTEDAPAEAPVD